MNQVKAGLEGLEITCPKQVVVAYEPIWAIGTGKTATAEDAQEVCGAIRETLKEMFGEELADGIRVLYGGSAKPGNIAELVAKPDVRRRPRGRRLRSRLPTSLYGRQGRRVGHMAQRHLPALLIIMDGCGLAPADGENAVAAAKTPFLDSLYEKYPHTTLGASGEDVGLPDGQMGNSEVGHLNIGAGRIVFQELSRINNAIKDGSIAKNEVFVKAMDDVKADGKTLHLMGLMSLAVFILI